MSEGQGGHDREVRLTGWVKQYTGELARYCRSRVKDPDVADDLVQMTFVAAWEGLDRFAGDSSPRTWLFSILKHKLTDHYRKAYREAERLSGAAQENDNLEAGLFDEVGHWRPHTAPMDDDTAFDDEKNPERMDRALRHCLDALPANWRSAIEMKYLMDKDAEAIQEALGLSASNYWQQLHRAKLKLRQCIEERTVTGKR